MSGATVNPLHAAHYADQALTQHVTVVENVALARNTFRIRVDCPEMARRFLPGQFLMLRLEGVDDPLLGRPMALYDTVVDEVHGPTGLDVVYLVVGKLTTRLADCQPGQQLQAWGPLGNGFASLPAGHLVMVAGGIGQTPFLALAQESLGIRFYGDPSRQPRIAARVTLCYGVRSSDLAAGVEDFQRIGVQVRISTEDGTQGHHGLVTDLLRQTLRESDRPCRVVCCGPEPMMMAVAKITSDAKIPCEVSLETPMACGIGICFSCVAKVLQEDGSWDYKRTCVEGPVFDASRIVW